jgi:hypothetical protein
MVVFDWKASKRGRVGKKAVRKREKEETEEREKGENVKKTQPRTG